MDHPLVWVDLEMTGLDPDRNVVVEIATVITDGALEIEVEGPDLVIHADEHALAQMEPVVVNMHQTSGLTEAIRASVLDVRAAEEETLAFVKQHVPSARTAPLAGNSVHADRAFLRKHMPALEAHLHYRNVDVSTVKELARRWYPSVLAGAPTKGGGHRALADIHESIEELRWYRRALFRAPAAVASRLGGIVVPVVDLDRMTAFWTAALGSPAVAEEGDVRRIQDRSGRVSLSLRRAQFGRHVRVNLHTASPDDEAARLVALGATLDGSDPPVLADPEGNLIGLLDRP